MKQTHHALPPSPHASGYAALCDLAKRGKGRKFLSVPTNTVREMLESYEEMLDIVAFDEAKKSVEAYVPKTLVDRLIAGESALRVYREHRALTQQMLATASGVSREMIAMIETGKKNGSLLTVRKLARALNVEIEDLV